MKKIFSLLMVVLLTLTISSFAMAEDDMIEGEDYFIYEGSGDDFIEIDKPEDAALLKISGNAEGRYFGVQGVNDQNENTQLFVNTTSIYDGIRPMDFDGSNTTMLEIEAPGEWRIGVFPVGWARSIDEVPGELSGTGDEVFLVWDGDSASRAYIEGNTQERYFGVVSWYERSELLVNTTQEYSGTVRLRQTPFAIEVEATGDWYIRFE